jgi:hypothetical protein
MKTIIKAAALALAPMTAIVLTSAPAAAQSKTGIAVVDQFGLHDCADADPDHLQGTDRQLHRSQERDRCRPEGEGHGPGSRDEGGWRQADPGYPNAI